MSAYIILLRPPQEGRATHGLYVALIPALIKVGNFFISLLDNYLVNVKIEKHIFDQFQQDKNLEETFPATHRLGGERRPDIGAGWGKLAGKGTFRN